MFEKFKNIHQIMEEYEIQKFDKEYSFIMKSKRKNELDGNIRMNYGLKSTNRHLTIWDDIGGIFKEYQGYVPLNGGNVVYMEV